ncbi:PRP19 [Scenedesmus sp. PABB004]|nr:PRP19 [Scenedesmus sp. PABB004]
MAMLCAISGGVPESPVVSVKSGHVFEAALINKYVAETGKCPITGAELGPADLLPLAAAKNVKPRSAAATSIPGLLGMFHDEWDALMLEHHSLRSSLHSTRQELSHALYQHDAACRVIARLMRERDEARAALATLREDMAAEMAAADARKRGADGEPGGEAKRSKADALGPDVIAVLDETNAALSSGRRKRPVPPGTASADDVGRFTLAGSFPLHKTTQPGVTCLALNPDQPDVVASCGADGSVQLFDVASRRQLASLAGHGKRVNAAVWGAGGCLVSASADKTVRFWREAEDGWACAGVGTDHAGDVRGLSAHPSRAYVVSASEDGSWAWWDVGAAAALKQVGGGQPYTSTAFHPDGLLLITGDDAAKATVWEMRSQAAVTGFDVGGVPSGFAFSENGYHVAAVAPGGVSLWDLRKMRAFRELRPYDEPVTRAAAYDFSSQFLAVGGADVRVYGAKGDWPALATLPGLPKKGALSLAWGPGARSLLVGAGDHNLRLYAPPGGDGMQDRAEMSGRGRPARLVALVLGLALATEGAAAAGGGARRLRQAAPRPAEPGSCACPRSFDPVCSVIGETYSNACLATCFGVEVDYEGACSDYDTGETKPPFDRPAPAGKVPASRKSPAPAAAQPTVAPSPKPATGPTVPVCMCSDVVQPVCGRDGVTYSNECVATCRAGVQVAAQGPCSAKPAAAAPAAAACTTPCPPASSPVCGSDQRTYANACSAACKGVAVASQGPCAPIMAGAAAPAPGPAPGGADASRCLSCPTAYTPVCGANGVTYLNACKAECAGITRVAAQGPCPTGAQPAVPAAVTPRPLPAGPATPTACLAACPKEGKQLCTVDGVTRINTCVAACWKDVIAYPGPCKDACRGCPSAWFPYCVATAAFGPRTFANCCFAKCSGIKVPTDVLHPGPCESDCGELCDEREEAPVCCAGRTYKNTCFAGCRGEDAGACTKGRCATMAGVEEGIGCALGPCAACPAGESPSYASPVCASNGRTFPDKCHLMCDQTLSIVAAGKCGVCAPGQPGGFPFCAPDDTTGLAPVCGVNGVTYRNAAAARAAGAAIAAGGACDKMCGEPGEACFPNTSGSTCCKDLRCAPQPDAAPAPAGGRPPAGVCVAPSGLRARAAASAQHRPVPRAAARRARQRRGPTALGALGRPPPALGGSVARGRSLVPRLRCAGRGGAVAARQPARQGSLGSSPATMGDSETVQCTAAKADGERCKRNTKDGDRCSSHTDYERFHDYEPKSRSRK